MAETDGSVGTWSAPARKAFSRGGVPFDGDNPFPYGQGLAQFGRRFVGLHEHIAVQAGREQEILTLIARGKSNAAIAEELTISLNTVRNHVSNIYSKLQVADRAQAAIRAREAGLS
jgi:DNA-binding CsgD family transcriptional regulator